MTKSHSDNLVTDTMTSESPLQISSPENSILLKLAHGNVTGNRFEFSRNVKWSGFSESQIKRLTPELDKKPSKVDSTTRTSEAYDEDDESDEDSPYFGKSSQEIDAKKRSKKKARAILGYGVETALSKKKSSLTKMAIAQRTVVGKPGEVDEKSGTLGGLVDLLKKRSKQKDTNRSPRNSASQKSSPKAAKKQNNDPSILPRLFGRTKRSSVELSSAESKPQSHSAPYIAKNADETKKHDENKSSVSKEYVTYLTRDSSSYLLNNGSQTSVVSNPVSHISISAPSQKRNPTFSAMYSGANQSASTPTLPSGRQSRSIVSIQTDEQPNADHHTDGFPSGEDTELSGFGTCITRYPRGMNDGLCKSYRMVSHFIHLFRTRVTH